MIPSLPRPRSQRRAVVTGGAGFIGSHVVDALLGRGYRVAVLDDLSTGRPENLAGARDRGAHFQACDVRDKALVDAIVAGWQPDLIVHLAAQIDVRISVTDPAHDAEVNVLGTIGVLEAARRQGVARVVLASTGGAIYGDAPVPTPESAPALPQSAYGQGKLSAEGYLGLYARLHGMSTIALRFANVYGPRQRADGEGGVVAIVAGRVQRDEAPTIFGDGHQTRDYVYVEDVVAAVTAAADRPDVTGVLNIGTGTETSVRTLVDVLRGFGGPDSPEPQFAPARPGEVDRSCLDPRRAAEMLGWQARIRLADGLARTYRSLLPTEAPAPHH